MNLFNPDRLITFPADDPQLVKQLQSGTKVYLAKSGDHRYADGWAFAKMAALIIACLCCYALALSQSLWGLYLLWYLAMMFCAVVNPIPISLTRALGADIVIAVDLQHDAHLMQQDLLSFNVSEENSENGDSLPWHARLKERLGSITTRRAVTAPTATEIMTTSIQVLENRLKRNRMAGDPPDILIQPVCPQISTLDFHRAHAAIAAGQLAVEKKMDELLPLVRTNI